MSNKRVCDFEHEAAALEYAAFLEKFEAKRTTDDCFTPPEVFAVVHRWVESEYGTGGRRIVRPFHPGGDFVRFEYQPGDLVLDNPPFSILSKIRRFYDEGGIDYFLFAPSLTLFSIKAPTMIVVGEGVEYANKANISTSFITSLEPQTRVRTAPALAQAIRSVRPQKPNLPKYVYPKNVTSSALLQKISSVDFSIPANECEFLSAMDAQMDEGKSVFGDGIIMSDRMAAELRAAELRAAELRAAELRAAELRAAVESVEWRLSSRELAIIERLNAGQSGDLPRADAKQAALFAGVANG